MIKQADVVLLGYPLGMKMPENVSTLRESERASERERERERQRERERETETETETEPVIFFKDKMLCIVTVNNNNSGFFPRGTVVIDEWNITGHESMLVWNFSLWYGQY